MLRKTLPLALCALIAGCGGKSPDSDAPATEDTSVSTTMDEQATPAFTAPPAPPPPSTTSVDDIDRWKRGMEAELKAVQEAAAKLADAKDDNAKLEALSAATEMNTIDAGANAAGVDRDQYRRIRNTLSNAVSQLSPIEMEMDVAQMPAEMIEQMKQARAASAAQLQTQLPADVLEALTARAAELRQQEKLLVAERMKVATSAR